MCVAGLSKEVDTSRLPPVALVSQQKKVVYLPFCIIALIAMHPSPSQHLSERAIHTLSSSTLTVNDFASNDIALSRDSE